MPEEPPNLADNRRSDDSPAARSADKFLLLVGLLLLLTPVLAAIEVPETVLGFPGFFTLFSALGGGLVGASIPGWLELKMKTLRAGGAVGLALVILYWDPAARIANSPTPLLTPTPREAENPELPPGSEDNADSLSTSSIENLTKGPNLTLSSDTSNDISTPETTRQETDLSTEKQRFLSFLQASHNLRVSTLDPRDPSYPDTIFSPAIVVEWDGGVEFADGAGNVAHLYYPTITSFNIPPGFSSLTVLADSCTLDVQLSESDLESARASLQRIIDITAALAAPQ